MFENIFDIFHEKEYSMIHFSFDFMRILYVMENNLSRFLIKHEFRSEFCYVDNSDKIGYVKVLPTEKYYRIIDKYSKTYGIDSLSSYEMKKNINRFKDKPELKKMIEKNLQYMRIGRLVRRLSEKEFKNSDVEIFVDYFKKIQIDKSYKKV